MTVTITLIERKKWTREGATGRNEIESVRVNNIGTAAAVWLGGDPIGDSKGTRDWLFGGSGHRSVDCQLRRDIGRRVWRVGADG